MRAKPVDIKLIVRYTIQQVSRLVGMGVALFWSAGRIDWWAAWAAIAVNAFWLAGTAIVILRHNPDLLAERLRSREGSKSWDTTIVGLLSLVTLIRYIVAGLDQRYGWSSSFTVVAQLTALIVCILGYSLFIWATASNAFFTQVLRIQTERGHTAEGGGPYRTIRHPAYLGAILYELAVSILLASWWAIIPSGVAVLMLILRTALEDRTLQAELTGYKEYTHQVRYRLLPAVW